MPEAERQPTVDKKNGKPFKFDLVYRSFYFFGKNN